MEARLKYWEIHAEYDGHVAGYRDEEYAKKRAEQLSDEFEQEHWVEKVYR